MRSPSRSRSSNVCAVFATYDEQAFTRRDGPSQLLAMVGGGPDWARTSAPHASNRRFSAPRFQLFSIEYTTERGSRSIQIKRNPRCSKYSGKRSLRYVV